MLNGLKTKISNRVERKLAGDHFDLLEISGLETPQALERKRRIVRQSKELGISPRAAFELHAKHSKDRF